MYSDDVSFIFPNEFEGHGLDSEELYYKPTAEDNDPERMKLGFDALMKIQKEAKWCWDRYGDENAWSQTVIWPLLNVALHEPRSSIWKVVCV